MMTYPVRSLVESLITPVKPYLQVIWTGIALIIALYVFLIILTHINQHIILHVKNKPGNNRDCVFNWLSGEEVQNAIEECKTIEKERISHHQRNSL